MRIVFDIPVMLFLGNQSLEYVPGTPGDAVGKPVLDKEHDILTIFYSIIHEGGEPFQFHRDGLYQVGRFVISRHCKDEDMSHTQGRSVVCSSDDHIRGLVGFVTFVVCRLSLPICTR